VLKNEIKACKTSENTKTRYGGCPTRRQTARCGLYMGGDYMYVLLSSSGGVCFVYSWHNNTCYFVWLYGGGGIFLFFYLLHVNLAIVILWYGRLIGDELH